MSKAFRLLVVSCILVHAAGALLASRSMNAESCDVSDWGFWVWL